MKVVSLISGGKDSLYNTLLAVRDGHEVVCLANLHPPEGTFELDSFMYQSVGAEGIKALAIALKLPLYRKEIIGTPKNTKLEYVYEEGDEVEDLYFLLQTIKFQFPEIKGVCVGAILSNYQKDRVENVCRRLKLKVLSYLWGQDQSELYDGMIASGIEAIIIKVAAAGLSSKHLGMSLKEARDSLIEAHKKFGLNICGEGGEYETFVVDSPIHESRISVDQCEAILYSDDSVAPVAFLRLSKLSLVSKPADCGSECDSSVHEA